MNTFRWYFMIVLAMINIIFAMIHFTQGNWWWTLFSLANSLYCVWCRNPSVKHEV